MARELRDLPGRKRRENRFGQPLALRLQPVDLVGDVGAVRRRAQRLDLRFELRDRLFEIEIVVIHIIGRPGSPRARAIARERRCA